MFKFCDALAILVGFGVLTPTMFLQYDWRASTLVFIFALALYTGLRSIAVDAKKGQKVWDNYE